MLFAHPIQHVLQLVIVQISERILRKLDRRGGLVRIAELQEEESMRGLAGHSPESEEARGSVVVLVYCLHLPLRYSKLKVKEEEYSHASNYFSDEQFELTQERNSLRSASLAFAQTRLSSVKGVLGFTLITPASIAAARTLSNSPRSSLSKIS